ncbi:hypothetical protein Pla123a_33330 [Posidoniimonas polymericola]|uniref:Uncharacterized protein n=1 Tax=Posidoniimonas polymericola TaxID=2528002 RepID=A0A5C5YGJ3_9BACT|nr:hypothetical protein [Posidoniimonas polymericola]TWT74510.1 hypothetical protein Pla123a_33330 [Posidoniimonas polymericola]
MTRTSILRIRRLPARRSGVTILECVGSLVMLSVLLTLVAKMTLLVDRQSELRWQQRLASATLSNLMEHASARPWEQLSTETLAADLGERVDSLRLPSPELDVEVTEAPGEPAARQINLSLGWSPLAAAKPQQLSLRAFVYRTPEANE